MTDRELIAFVETLGDERIWELALQVLPTKQYEVYLFRVGLEWTWADIVEVAGTSRQNVQDLHRRATKRIYEALVKLYEERVAA